MTCRLFDSASRTVSTRPTWIGTWRTSTQEPADALRYGTISFITDYGLTDEFVGVVKSVVHSIAPDVRIIDITHDVDRYDVRAGGLALARAAQYLNPGVVLAVVDPTVGGDRRPIAVEVGGGESVLVGPDNGLLAPAVSLVGGADRVVELRNERYRLPSDACTFDGRDVFGPAAAHLAAGVPLEDLGPLLDPSGLVPGIVPTATVAPHRIDAEVLWVDRYGNVQLNVDPADLDGLGERIALRAGGELRTAQVARSYAAIPPGALGLVVDSYGLVSVAQDRREAAAELGLSPGSAVTLARPEDLEAEAGDAPGGTGGGAESGAGTVSVRLSGRPGVTS